MYAIGYKRRVFALLVSARRTAGKRLVFFVWLLAVLLLVLTGTAYRVLASHLHRIHGGVALPVSLDSYPRRIGQWVGEDVPIPLNIQKVAGNDAFVNRLYKNKTNKEWVNVYIAYTSQPRNMLGHRPRTCYVAGGWVHDGTKTGQFITRLGRKTSCLLHRFHKPSPNYEATIVLNFYVVNGILTCDHKNFSGISWRAPNIKGDPARYVAQVQISSLWENSARAAARDMTDLILNLLPDENGRVKAAEYVEPLSEQEGIDRNGAAEN